MFSAEREITLARFADRRDAGRQLAAQLLPLAGKHPVVVGLPRGGIPVASEIATALRAPLEILAVRKLGAPHNPEYGIGAIVEDGTRIFDSEALAALAIDGGMLESIVARASEELHRRVVAYRGGRLPTQYRSHQYVVNDWRGHHLSAPPRGYQWVQTGGDYVLVAIATGIIASILLNQ